MYTLGIETSCDETSASVVNNRRLLSCVTFSSLNEHKKYGGIIPEIASRRHLKVIDRVTKQAVGDAGIDFKDLRLVSVTQGPGLSGSLLTGVSFAKSLAYSLSLPFIGVNHLYAHLFNPFINKRVIEFPFVGLIASGGHSEIYLVKDFDRIDTLASTRDDAAGEALDKVGRFYGVGFPGGPAIDRLFNERIVDENLFRMKRLKGLGFSFSGIKTKAVYLYKQLVEKKALSSSKMTEILSSFQYAVVDSLIYNLTESLKETKIKKVALGGGVAANSLLRRRVLALRRKGVSARIPPLQFCQDNAAGTAGLGEYLYKKGYSSGFDIPVLCRAN